MARVLVVEHDPAIRRLLALHLESETHDVMAAEDGEQGLRMAIESRPDLIVSESRTPRLNGIEMLRGIRSNAPTAATPFIFLADSDDTDLRARSSAMRVSDYLTKPFNRESLLKAVSKQTQTRQRRSRQLEIETQELTPVDHSETMAMAPEYAAPLPEVDTPARDATSRAVEGTVMFFAIRDFNRIGEALGDQLQLELFNTFYENVRDVVTNGSGWIVKTIEGGFIAMFEDGVTSSIHHAERAAKTAILCVLALHRYGPWVAKKLGHGKIPALAAITGMHSGPLSVCNLYGGKAGGKSERTIIGDTVNVASRLQARAGELGWGIVVSDTTQRGAGPRFGLGRKGQIQVKGRKAPLGIVEITALQAKPGADAIDGGFYIDVASALSANARLLNAQNSIREPEAAAPPSAPAAIAPAPAPAPSPAAPALARPAAESAVPAPEPSETAPITVDGYRVLRKIGEGGMAQVYLAQHLASDSKRVLKLVRLTDEHESETAKRFVQEYALLTQSSHPNVARVYQHGHEGGYAYMAMEYFADGDLRGFLREPRAPSMAIAVLIQIASGITAVHRLGVVHRDLKPDNIMIRADGSMAIADFGIAKKVGDAHGPTQHGDVLGTPYYLSPEQVLGEPADHRADIYSIGVIFYEMLTGKRAYTADTAMGLMHQHAHSPVPLLPEQLERYQALLERMMNKDKHRRFGGATEIIDFIMHYQLA